MLIQWKFLDKFKWLLHVKHTLTTPECLREQKFKDIEERIKKIDEFNENASLAIKDIYAKMNGDADWFIHIARKREDKPEEDV